MLPVTQPLKPIETPKINLSNIFANIKNYLYRITSVRYDDFDECHEAVAYGDV